MKKVLSVVMVLCLMMSFVPCVHAEEVHYDLSGKCLFKFYENGFNVNIKDVTYDKTIELIGAMELQGNGYPSYFYEEMGGWGMPEDDGVRSAGVYKKELSVKKEGEYYIVFEAFKDRLKLYLNGEKVGESRNGAIGDSFKVSLKKENELVFVVERNKSGIDKEDNFGLSGFFGKVYVTDKEPSYERNTDFLNIEDEVLIGVRYTPSFPEGGFVTDEQARLDAQLICDYGFNAVWTSCAPEAFYEEAERLNLYIIDEANINLAYFDRDKDAAKARCEEMVNRHGKYKNIVMWSAGFGDSQRARELVEYIKTLDSRPVAEEAVFAQDFKVFGNTGGMSDWVKELGDGNIGGFVDEFCDKELYYTQKAYEFETKDSVTGEIVKVDGEVENYNGIQMLGDASYVRNIDKMDKYTIVTELGAVNGDRVIFESGSVKLEVSDNRVRFSVGNKRARTDAYEGRIAAVYMDGEIQLFANGGFVENAEAEAEIEGSYSVGGGDTAIGYVEIYSDALTLEELLEGADEEKLVSRVQFEDIDIKKDKSYEFLAYGGDFGDNPNSYYKCLTGIFTSTREPHPEATAFKALLTNNVKVYDKEVKSEKLEKTAPVVSGETAVFKNEKMEYAVNFDGKIVSVKNSGKELLAEAVYPTTVRDMTLEEYEQGQYTEESWRRKTAEVSGNMLYVTLESTIEDAQMLLMYSMEGNYLRVGVQTRFSDGASKPAFIGFKGVGAFDKVKWDGYKESSYPDREALSEAGVYEADIEDMTDNYAVPQESGNRKVISVSLENTEGDMLTFDAAAGDMINFKVDNSDPESLANADHDEDVIKTDKAYFRVGGFIKGLSNKREYKLNNNIYGFDFFISAEKMGSTIPESAELYLEGRRFDEFTTGVYTYVYRTDDASKIEGKVEREHKAVIGDYTVYFAPATRYLSDMEEDEKTAEIAKDCDFNRSNITMRGNDYWAPAVSYDKGIALKGGSVTYDVSECDWHMFTAVVGKNDFDWRSMGGGFDRNMFEASCDVTISLDGVVVEEIKGISMRSGAKEISVDVWNADTLTITVKGSGKAPQYEDAVLADAKITWKGPCVAGFEKKDGKAEITILNTDKDYVDVVLTATEDGKVTTSMGRVEKGLYQTISVECGEKAFVKAYVTGLGEIIIPV